MEEYVSKMSEEVDMPTKIVDYSDVFTTKEVFTTRDDLLNWARAIGGENGFVIVIAKSETGGIGRKTFVILVCERSGKHRQYKYTLAHKMTRTKKCERPFKLRGTHVKYDDGWKVNVVCGFHNHEVAETLVGHPYADRLSGEEKSLVRDMTKNMIKPRSILLTLKHRDMDNVTTIKQIYNVCHAFQKSLKGPRTEMQHLMKLMERDHYVHWHRRDETSDIVRDIFWTHPDSIKLLNAFYIVLLIDSTYKTNRYQLPLLEIVGVTSTDLTFSVTFTYLESERADNFNWALHKLRGLVLKDDVIPGVIVTDRDIALMKACNISGHTKTTRIRGYYIGLVVLVIF